MKTLPKRGFPAETILSTMRELRNDDVNWEDGRVWSLVFHAGDEISAFLKEAYTTYFSENALNPSAFPSLKRMEAEVVSMTLSLLNGTEDSCGNMTSGGTESILMAVKTARAWAEKNLKTAGPYEVLMPTSAHPAFDKACYYFGLKAVHIPVGPDFRADVKAMKKAYNKRTVLIVGSAPQYPQGLVDPIEELAAFASSKGILMHVDGCVGGFMLPFVRMLGRDIPDFDLAVPGVTSMSVDLHKYAYAAKGASCVLYNSRELRKLQYFAEIEWTGGIYASPTMLGTRSGGSIAAAWAILHRLGTEGYLEIAEKVMDATDRLVAGVNAIDGVKVMGVPHMSVFSIGSDDRDAYEIADGMTARGWHLDRQQHPPCIHVTVNFAHIASTDEFLADLAAATREAKQPESNRTAKRVANFAMRSVVRVLPAVVVSKAMDVATGMLGLGGGDGLPEKTAPMYGMMTTLPNRGDIKKIIIDVLDGLTSYDPNAPEILEGDGE